jgi:hypothetical protein
MQLSSTIFVGNDQPLLVDYGMTLHSRSFTQPQRKAQQHLCDQTSKICLVCEMSLDLILQLV